MKLRRGLALCAWVMSLAIAGLACFETVVRGADDSVKIPNTENPRNIPLQPEAALSQLSLPDGFRTTLFAAEPNVQQPIGMTTDERGRLWVAECYTYAERELNFATDLKDRIVILEDTDHDGHHDRRTVFWDQGRKLTSVEVGFGGVWALCAPQLLFIPDRNHDDVPDGPPQVVLDGWDEGTVRHNIVNGLKWGPDGWLYGRHGIQATSLVGKPGASESQRVRLNCSIWRYHPTRDRFEVVGHGTTNSWGFDYDDFGEMFFINTVIGHLWHLVPGAHYRRMYGADFNPYTYQLIDQCADHYHWDTGEAWSDIRKGVSDTTLAAGGGHAHSGLMIYLGDSWPKQFRGDMFTLNFHGRRANRDHLERRGAGYVAKHAPDFFSTGDLWFRGMDLIYGPDGGVFVADWSDVGECHENDGVHRTSGRLYKITFGQPALPLHDDLSRLSDQELVDLQLQKNDWYVRQGRRLLQERAAAGRDLAPARAKLTAMATEHADATRRLRAFWCLYVTGGVEQPLIDRMLADHDEHVRSWAVRLVADESEPSPGAQERFVRLASEDASGLVNLYLASALQRMTLSRRWPLAKALSSRDAWMDDPAFPLMLWYGIEPAVAADSKAAVMLLSECRIPLVRRFIARRVAGRIEEDPAGVERLADALGTSTDAMFQADVLAGMSQALEGWRKAPAPSNWSAIVSRLEARADPSIRRASASLSAVFGDGRAIESLQTLVSNDKADPETRERALRTLVTNHSEGLVTQLHKLLTDRVLVVEAIRGLASYGHSETPSKILSLYLRLSPEGRAAAIDTLCSRPAYAVDLLKAVADSRVPRADLSAFHARQIRAFNDAELNRQLTEVWGDTRTTPAEKRAEIVRLAGVLTPSEIGRGNLPEGRVVFQKTCGNCHVLFGEGKKVGPDLTGSNRRNLEYLLENLVDPSAQVAADFRVSTVVLDDGRIVNGVIVEKLDRTISVQTLNERIILDRSTIEEVQPTTLSLMPDSILKTLTPEQLRNLVAYLMSTHGPAEGAVRSSSGGGQE